jgi:hypothetical protein
VTLEATAQRMLVQEMATWMTLAQVTPEATAQQFPAQEKPGAVARQRTTAQPGATWGRSALKRPETMNRPTVTMQAGARRSEGLHGPCSDRRRSLHQQ